MRNLSLIIFSFLVLGCNEWKEKKLNGKWQASEVFEDGMPLETDISVVSLEFLPNGNYRFTSTLKYREAGTYSVEGDLLYTLDTINKASSEKAVKILELTSDSLFIKMNAEGKERIVKMFKVK